MGIEKLVVNFLLLRKKTLQIKVVEYIFGYYKFDHLDGKISKIPNFCNNLFIF